MAKQDTTEPTTTAQSSSKKVQARVICACALGSVDDVVTIDPATAGQYAGQIDTNPAAVAYAKSLKGGA